MSQTHPAVLPPPITADLPGVGGRIKVQLDDFEVEEIPAYEPSGGGEHLYLWVEKRGLGPEFFVQQVGQRLGLPTNEIGTAGLKDRHAVTRQWVSVPKHVEPRLPQIDGDGIRVLNVSRHTNKLKTGHLRGNRFRILVSEAEPVGDRVGPIVERLQRLGMPNYYGPQRFGRGGTTHETGLRLLAGERVGRLPPFRLRLHLSAVQSLLFNDWLIRRVADGLYRSVLPGDVMMKWPAGGLFVADDVAVEQERFDRRETVVGGPMFGAKTFATQGVAAEREAAVLADSRLSAGSFAAFDRLMPGTRRHSQVYVDELAAVWEPDGLRLGFALPAGSYATVLLREIMKADVDADE